MRDFSINLPSWAVREGYRLEGGVATFDDLFLYRHGRLVKWWDCIKLGPNIFELEDIIVKYKGKETSSVCDLAH